MNLYGTTEAKAFYAAMASNYCDIAVTNAFTDWLIDQGEDEFRARETVLPPVYSQYLPSDYYGRGIGSGIGRGSGSGIGRGIGRGSGIGIGSGIGSGSGRGIGRGRGSGSGRGSGIGIGIGIGSGSGSGRGSGSGSGKKQKEIEFMESGKCYLILTVDWFAFVGRCLRQIGPWEYEFEKVSKFDTNAGDVFGEIAAGDKQLRARATYQHFSGKAILGMGRVACFEWVGRVPQEYDTRTDVYV